jgi:predicted PurR-regulated permease PerM
MPRKIEISHKTIIFAVVFLLGLQFIYIIRDILFELFIALLIMTILDPLVGRLTGWKVPRAISVLLAYILVIGVLGGTIALIVPAVVEQTTNFVNAIPTLLTKVGIDSMASGEITKELLTQVGTVPGQVLKFTFSVFSNVIGVITVLIFAFYMLLSRDKLEDQLGFLFGEERRRKIGRVIDALENKLGGWARGELTLMFFVGLATYIGLLIIGIPFALPLAILAGLFEIVPFLGPIIASIPAIIIGLGISPLTGLGVAAMAFLINQLENYLLVPKIMEKSVGISPLIILIALTIGARLAGIIGIIISVPFVITLQVLVSEYLKKEA